MSGSHSTQSLHWQSRLIIDQIVYCSKSTLYKTKFMWFKEQFSESKSGEVFMKKTEEISQVSVFFTHPYSKLKPKVFKIWKKLGRKDTFFFLSTFLGIFLTKQNQTYDRHWSRKTSGYFPVFWKRIWGIIGSKVSSRNMCTKFSRHSSLLLLSSWQANRCRCPFCTHHLLYLCYHASTKVMTRRLLFLSTLTWCGSSI